MNFVEAVRRIAPILGKPTIHEFFAPRNHRIDWMINEECGISLDNDCPIESLGYDHCGNPCSYVVLTAFSRNNQFPWNIADHCFESDFPSYTIEIALQEAMLWITLSPDERKLFAEQKA